MKLLQIFVTAIIMLAASLGHFGMAQAFDMRDGITPKGYVYQQTFIPRQTLNFDLKKTALLVIDPQNDFMSKQSPIWALVGPHVEGQHLVEHLVQLIDAAKKNDMFVFYSPHMYTRNDRKDWKSLNGIDKIMFENSMFVENTKGHDFVPALAPSENTIVLNPHKGLSNFWSGDIAIQMRERGIETIIIAGMAANMCVDAHLRDAVENGFDLIVVADAIAGAGELAMQAAWVNYEFLAHEVVTTDQIIKRLHKTKKKTEE